MTSERQMCLSLMPDSPAIREIKASAEAEMWRAQCLQAVEAEPVVELISPAGPYEHSGTYLLRLSDTRIYWVNVVDHGWECDEPGELDDDGNVIVESTGSSCIATDVIDLHRRPLVPKFHEDYYHEESILGIVYAIQRANEEGESITEPGHYWNYVSRQLEEIAQD